MPSEVPTRRLSIRLLKAGIQPASAYRGPDSELKTGPLNDSVVVYGATNMDDPKWASFLGIPPGQLKTRAAFAIFFLKVSNRWFAITFGYGFSKLDPALVEPNFGLKVVLNAVEPKSLYSADTRIPEQVTLTRRTQTSVRSDQNAFGIDPEHDLMKAVAGEPRDKKVFGKRIAGSDGVTLALPVSVNDLPTVCGKCLEQFSSTKYQEAFSWIDRIKHVRDFGRLEDLNGKLLDLFQASLAGDQLDTLQLVRPRLFDPEKPTDIQYVGLNSRVIFPDLDIRNYLELLEEAGIQQVTIEHLKHHKVREIAEDGTKAAPDTRVYDCIAAEVSLNSSIYILSSAMWFNIDDDLSSELNNYFASAPKTTLPEVKADETESKYNKRIAGDLADSVCLDAKTVKAKKAHSGVEVCDVYTNPLKFIHMKDQTISAKLSHLFSQGLVSALSFLRDETFREEVQKLISNESSGSLGAEVPISQADVKPQDLEITFGVMKTKPANGAARLPFFSLITFKTLTTELTERHVPWKFGWAFREKPVAKPKPRKKKAGA